MSRRLFIKILLALGLGNFFPKFAEAARLDELHTPQDGYRPLTSAKFLRQVVTKDSRTSRMLMWQADAQENFSVEWQLVGEDVAHFSDVTQKTFEDEIFCSCALENLKPESLYKFRIVSGERATAWQNLRTAGDGKFQMLIFADSQCEFYSVWQRTADTAHENFPDAELVTVVGDLVDNGQATYQWRAWHLAAEFHNGIAFSHASTSRRLFLFQARHQKTRAHEISRSRRQSGIKFRRSSSRSAKFPVPAKIPRVPFQTCGYNSSGARRSLCPCRKISRAQLSSQSFSSLRFGETISHCREVCYNRGKILG